MTAVMFIVFLVCLVLSFPVAIAMGLAAITPGIVDPTFSADVVYIIRAMVVGIDSTPILAIPLFILSGTIMAQGGISGKLFDVFAYFLGKRTGGLPCAVIVTCLFYGAISGSGPATCAAVGAMTVPLLVSLGYEKSFCSAIVATAGGLGLIIPPSISFVNYALVTGTSVTSLFTAGILPGCLIALFLMAYCYFYCRSHGEDKEKIAKNCAALHSRSLGRVFKEGFWALLSPVIILGGIYSGAVTPTEAACVSVFYAIIVSVWIYKTMRLRDVITYMKDAVKSYAPICLLIAFAIAFGRVLVLLKAPELISDFITTTFSTKYAFLIVLNLVLLLLGMFMDTASAIAILGPILLQTAESMGINGVQFGVILVTNLAVGLVSPPIGINLIVAAPLVGESSWTIGKHAIPFIGFFLIALLLITFIPAISLVLL